MSLTFSRYIGRQFLFWFAVTLAGLLFLIFLLESIELLRRASGQPDIGMATILGMALLKLPQTAQRTVPFAVLFGTMYTLWRLMRTQELVIARAAGISAWQFLAPLVLAALLIGTAWIAAVTPVSAAFASRYDRLEARHFQGRTSFIKVTGSGLWLRQLGDTGETILRAAAISPEEAVMREVTVFQFDLDGGFAARIDAPEAALRGMDWVIPAGIRQSPDAAATQVQDETVLSGFPLDRIEETFVEPEALSFWDLRDFIQTLEATGFSAARHRIYYQTLVAKPAFLMAMVLLAAAFSLRLQRRGGSAVLVLAGIVAGLLFYAFTDFMAALGQGDRVPPMLAAWISPLVASLLGTAGLLHAEGG